MVPRLGFVVPSPLLPTQRFLTRLALVFGFGVLACDDEKPLTAPQAPESGRGGSTIGADMSAMGTIPLPVLQSFSGGLAFGITQIGTGGVGKFQINNANSSAAALSAGTTGLGPAGVFQSTNANADDAMVVQSNGIGRAAIFENANTTGGGIVVSTVGRGTPSGIFQNNSSTGAGLQALSNGGAAGLFRNFRSGPGIQVRTVGTGWAGDFTGQGRGVRITTNLFAPGLQVVNGTKNAVVGTTTGARALYTEESSEVWFTDYGFGRLAHGRARILIEPTFAQTMNSDEPYHVFIEEYGDAQLYVAERTPLGFVVKSHDGTDVEFSYRIVGRRRGYETHRLERAPWADTTAGFQLNH